jgi:hypothetical protein
LLTGIFVKLLSVFSSELSKSIVRGVETVCRKKFGESSREYCRESYSERHRERERSKELSRDISR